MNGERSWGRFERALAVFLCVMVIAACSERSPIWGGDESANAPVAERVDELIEQLGSSNFELREAAAKELVKIGKLARPRLVAAKNHRSAEVRSRVTQILRQFTELPLGEAFQTLAKQPDEKLDVEEGMWLIARILNPEVERETLTNQLDALAERVRRKLGKDELPNRIVPDRIVAVIREVLFDDEKFGGNFADYQNPANSSLEKVLEARKGLPILVSHVVVAVGKRLDVPIVGLPTPGRYIVKYDGKRAPHGAPRDDIYFDPFNNGALLTRADRMELFGEEFADKPIEPGPTREVLIRMLYNIETHLLGRDEPEKAYQAVEFRVALQQQGANSDP